MCAPCFGSVFCIKNHYPRSREHFFIPSPSAHRVTAQAGVGADGRTSFVQHTCEGIGDAVVRPGEQVPDHRSHDAWDTSRPFWPMFTNPS